MDVLSFGVASAARKDAAQALLLSRGQTYVGTEKPVGDTIGFAKAANNPQIELADTDLPTMDWPWIIRVDGLLEDPLGRYYWYFGTDHAQAAGHVVLAYADSLTGPWTYLGKVYQYNETAGGSGTETETPSVIWDELNSRFVMYHQQVQPTGAVASQVTMYATSPDGITWTAGGIALDLTGSDITWPAPGHLGYFRPFRVGEGWYAYSLLSGTTKGARFALSQSTDGIKWDLDPRPLGWGAEYLDANHRIEWNTSSVVLWRGRWLWIGLISTFASGSMGRDAYWAVAPLADDFRSLIGAPRKLFDPTQAWEGTYMSQGHMFVDEGRLCLMYRSGPNVQGAASAFGLAIAEAI